MVAPEVLLYKDFPVPQPRRGEALVKVHAVGLNGYDLMARAGRYKPNKGRFPHILGGDFGGELVALGPETTCDFPLGTRVTSWWILPAAAVNSAWLAIITVVRATIGTWARTSTGPMRNMSDYLPII